MCCKAESGVHEDEQVPGKTVRSTERHKSKCAARLYQVYTPEKTPRKTIRMTGRVTE